jgi:nitrogen regulatory protein PII
MKMVTAIIKPFKLDEVREALHEIIFSFVKHILLGHAENTESISI